MILADTSIWVRHLKSGFSKLATTLQNGMVYCHPFIIGELSLGGLEDRNDTLSLLKNLPMAKKAEDEEILEFIEKHRLHSRGIGWVDTHLLASALLSDCGLWTFDRALNKAAGLLGVETL